MGEGWRRLAEAGEAAHGRHATTGRAVVTAVLGAIGWALVSWIPLIGPVIALGVWIGVLKWRYPGGWVTAATMGLIAWVAALRILVAVDTVFGVGIGALGVPGA